MLRKALPWLLLGLAATAPASGQSDKPLRVMLSDLFTFGTCGEPLCLDGSISAENGHGDHYLPAVATGNLALISFIEDAIGKSVSATPLSATSSGASFTIVGGIPVRSTNSAGPIFAEQSRTLGRGRVFLGFKCLRFMLKSFEIADMILLCMEVIHLQSPLRLIEQHSLK